jgi:hypothetical protein
MSVEQGAFQSVEKFLNKLSQISDEYENDHSKGLYYELKIKSLLKQRKLNDAQVAANTGISFLSKIGQEIRNIYLLGTKSEIQILLNDIKGAKETLSEVKESIIEKARLQPFYIGCCLKSQFIFDLQKLEEAIMLNDKSGIIIYNKRMHQNIKPVLKNSKKVACERTEIFRLIGIYHWIIGKQRMAIYWCDKSIREGKVLNAK